MYVDARLRMRRIKDPKINGLLSMGRILSAPTCFVTSCIVAAVQDYSGKGPSICLLCTADVNSDVQPAAQLHIKELARGMHVL